jgi:glycosyltransferase-like protein LARGE
LATSSIHLDLYPINRMRNFAMDYADTDFVFPLDVDFVPSVGTLQHLRTLIHMEGWGDRLRQHKEVLILPAFERFMINDTQVSIDEVPSTKTELLIALKNNEVSAFHAHNFIPGHGPTDFKKWYNATAIYPITWLPQFEPYFVVARRDLPPYWDSFVGFGYNKLSWVTELHAAGYQFLVDSQSFVTHMNHPYLVNKKKNKRSAKWEMMDEYFLRFGLYLKQKYRCSVYILRRDFVMYALHHPKFIHLLLLF